MSEQIYLPCEHFAKPEDITEIDSMLDGEMYLCRVLLRSGDRQWAEWMTIETKRLAEVIFP